MSAHKLPAFQFYPGDWRKDPGIQSLSFEERGVWVELLCLMHESSPRGKLLLGGSAYPIDRLARALCLSPEVMGKVISALVTLGVAAVCADTGALVCKRMVRDDEIIKKRAECGKLGGNPQFKRGAHNPYYPKNDKQVDNQDHKQKDNQKITPSSSSSSSDIQTDLAVPHRIPTADEWQQYCAQRYPEWPTEDVRAAWEHYESLGWKKGKTPVIKWKLCASTCHRNYARAPRKGSAFAGDELPRLGVNIR